MKRIRLLPYFFVAMAAFVCGNWFGESQRLGIGEARAEDKSDTQPSRTKVQSLEFVDARGVPRAELLVREVKINGQPTMQLALVDRLGRDVWTGPAAMQIVPAR
jgi:hypothetical protein